MKKKAASTSKVYLVGSGLASLASAVFLIRDCKLPGKNIRILEQDRITGGCLDGIGNVDEGFVARGGRMHEKNFRCYWDLLSTIPSATDPNKSVTQETFEFNEKYVSNAQSRLIEDTNIIDLSSFGLRLKDKYDMLTLRFCPEKWIGNKKISDWFSPGFFKTKFWLIWSTMFAFQKWSSVVEMRRYFLRFMHLVSGLHKLGGIMRTVYNQYDSLVAPIQKWLMEKGVNFELETQVVDIDFSITANSKKATAISCISQGEEKKIPLTDNDCLFITNGSIVDSTDVGSMTKAAVEKTKESSGAWMLWEKIAQKDRAFGSPGVFSNQIDLQKWSSFTVTIKDPRFLKHLEEKYNYIPGVSGLMTITGSSWLLSIVVPAQPHFPNQPEDTLVIWGYGLYATTIGDYVKKKMPECTGEEILTELFAHMQISELMKPVLEAGDINCKPVSMPFIDSLFMPRNRGDRPAVIPKGATNFAFLGQFSDIPHDVVFTVEYSTRSAMMAAYNYYETDKKVPPVFVGAKRLSSIINAIKAINR